ncbi:MAG: TolC family protein [[Clostridium] fimetarium]|nr:TolC family protein [Alistipes timonensis]MCM1404832.1 TolC family protein [[Clostridium] fimetarium]
MIKEYGIIDRMASLSLSDINRGWLPRVGVYAQGTAQNAVPAFPDQLGDMLDHMGQSVAGMSKFQWKAGVDASQTIWDGGASKADRALERAKAEQSRVSVEVELYNVGTRVRELYFGILLMREQMVGNGLTIELLENNHRKMLSKLANGTATQADADMVEAELLQLRQRQSEAEGAFDAYTRSLEILIGESLGGRELEMPSAELPGLLVPERPEQRLYDARMAVNYARAAAVEPSVMPRFSLFAQGYYGNPGLDYFKSMMTGNPSLNLLAGVKVTWNIDSFYTRGNRRRRYRLDNLTVEAERGAFLLNTALTTESDLAKIKAMERIIADDRRIVTLRESVRLAAESHLANGVIDTNTLLSKINDENQARLSAAYHEIQLLQNISNLRHNINR